MENNVNNAFIIFLTFMFMFMCGSVLGWVMELLFRNIVINKGRKKWVNPGFLTGPCVPLYGFGLCTMYALASINVPIKNAVVSHIVLFAVMAAAMTLIEYIAGLIFIRGMKIKLWDYSKNWGNINGIICPAYSLLWAVLSAVYYFLVHPLINDSLYWFVNNIWFSYFVGIFSGVFAIDFAVSLNISNKIRAFAKEQEVVVRFEEFKKKLIDFKEENKLSNHFMFAMQNAGKLRERLKDYYDDVAEDIKGNKIKKDK